MYQKPAVASQHLIKLWWLLRLSERHFLLPLQVLQVFPLHLFNSLVIQSGKHKEVSLVSWWHGELRSFIPSGGDIYLRRRVNAASLGAVRSNRTSESLKFRWLLSFESHTFWRTSHRIWYSIMHLVTRILHYFVSNNFKGTLPSACV